MPTRSTVASPLTYRWHAEPSAERSMRYDAERASSGEWALRCYTWDAPAITYGYFQQLEPFVDLARLQATGIETARRPTGGGIVLHGGDLTYSVVVPRADAGWRSAKEAFCWAGELVAGVLRSFHVPAEVAQDERPCCQPQGFCGVHPALGDVLVDGRKLAGCAVRRRRTAWLLQGYLNLQPPPEGLLACLRNPWPERLQGASTDARFVLGYVPPPKEFGEQLADALRHL